MLPDFSRVTAESIRELTAAALAAADREVDAAVTDSTDTFAGTLGRLEAAATHVSDAAGSGAFMARVHPDPDVREAGVDAEAALTQWGNDLIARRDLFEAIERYAATGDAEALTGTRRRLLDHWRRDLRRAGHLLDEADRAALQGLRSRLIDLEVAFGKNLDDAEGAIEVSRDQLDGLPDAYIEALGPGAEPGTYRVTTAYPDYLPFLQQATNRDLRRRLQYEFWTMASAANRPLLEEAIATRSQIASLLGHPSWAHHAMEVKMANHPDAVAAFYDSIVPGLQAKAQGELAQLQQLLESDVPGETLRPWDQSFYHTMQKRTDFGVDQNEVAAYFALERVLEGMFELTADVFGLEYRRVESPDVWHPDVALYEMRDAGTDTPLAYFYTDLFPRPGKYSHAAAFSIVYGERLGDGTYRTPVAAIVANLTKPGHDRPSLLKHREALTLFHEFGHILHFCLTTVDLIRFSGYDTEWDFVEAPSQIMEHWMWEPSVLRRFARHYATDEAIPVDLVDRLVAARDLNKALDTLRQVFLGRLDLGLHDDTPDKDIDAITLRAFETTLLPFHEGTDFASGFGHLMGGYDAGYYGYLWAQVYGDDMFSRFQEEGITSAEVGAAYRRDVLASGGSRDAIDHLRAFLGREPSSEAFLRNLGLR